MKKYKLTDEKLEISHPQSNEKVTLYRIQSLIDFGDVKKGDIGGYIQNKRNLDDYYDPRFKNENLAWAYDSTKIFDNGTLIDNAKIYDYTMVYGYSVVRENISIFDYIEVFNDANLCGECGLYGKSKII